jgi:hypothetical protein
MYLKKTLRKNPGERKYPDRTSKYWNQDIIVLFPDTKINRTMNMMRADIYTKFGAVIRDKKFQGKIQKPKMRIQDSSRVPRVSRSIMNISLLFFFDSV